MIKNITDKSRSIILSVDRNKIDFSVDYVKYKISEDDKLIILDIKELPDEHDKSVYLKIQYMPFSIDDENYESETNINIMEFELSLLEIDDEIKALASDFIKMDLPQEQCEEAFKDSYAISTSAIYQNFAIEEYQMHLKILGLLSPNSTIVMDLPSCCIRSGVWLRHTLNFALPPSLSYLFTVHSVYDDDKDEHEYWFHTHGLNRLGLPEIEIIGAHDDSIAYGLSNLITTAAKFIIEKGVYENLYEQSLELTYGMPTVFIKFSDAKKYFDGSILGMSSKDRDDDIHSINSLVILPIKDDSIALFEDYSDKLGDNAIFALSNFETTLMREAARTTVSYFIDLLDVYKDNENFSFIIKLGYNDIESEEIEHLWFDVHDFNRDELLFDATLINKPYYNIGLVEGQRGQYELSRLTDWLINIEEYSYTSANIYMLFDN